MNSNSGDDHAPSDPFDTAREAVETVTNDAVAGEQVEPDAPIDEAEAEFEGTRVEQDDDAQPEPEVEPIYGDTDEELVDESELAARNALGSSSLPPHEDTEEEA